MLLSVNQADGQDSQSYRMSILKMPLYYLKRAGNHTSRLLQAIVLKKQADIVFSKDGKELLKSQLVRGNNRFLLTFPAVTVQRK